MSITASAREVLWYYGFIVFCELKHPRFRPLQILKRFVPTTHPIAGSIELVHPHVARVPKRIWIYWAQGWDQAPRLVELCKNSWITRNPGWEIILLDKDVACSYVELGSYLQPKNIPHAAYSDVLRVRLLEKYGGVWADATVLCMTPLDEWLTQRMQSGFFAFGKSKTTIASWCMSAEPGNKLVRMWALYVERYWKFAQTPGWYFWFHYLFEYLILLDAHARYIWRNTPCISSENSYLLQRSAKAGGSTAAYERILADPAVPVHKLDWKMDIPKTLLDALSLASQNSEADSKAFR